MAEDTTAFVIPLHQVPLKKKDKTSAERAKAYRQRKKQKAEVGIPARAEPASSESLIPAEFLPAIAEPTVTTPSITSPTPVTPRLEAAVTQSRHNLASVLLTSAALVLAGVGISINFCREREAAVAERRQVLDFAQASVGQGADPQTDAVVRLIVWGTRGMLRPGSEDFAMVRLILLALLPQIGRILMMVGRYSARVIEADKPVMVANSEASIAC